MASVANRDLSDKGLSPKDLLYYTAGGTVPPTSSVPEQPVPPSSSSAPNPTAAAAAASSSSSPDKGTSIRITHLVKKGRRVSDRVRNRSGHAVSTSSIAEVEAADPSTKDISCEPILTEDIKKRQAIFEKSLVTASDRTCQLTANSALGKNRELREALKLPVRTISQRASEILNATILSAESRVFLNRMSSDLNLENERFSYRSQMIQAAQVSLSDISTADLLHDPASKLGQISRRAQAGIFTPLEMPEKKQHRQTQLWNTERSPFAETPIVNRAALPAQEISAASSSSAAAAAESSSPPSNSNKKKNTIISSSANPPSLPVAHFKEPVASTHFSSSMAVLRATPPSAPRSPSSPGSPPSIGGAEEKRAVAEDTSAGYTIGAKGDKKISWSFMSTAKRNSMFSLHKFGGLLGSLGADREAGLAQVVEQRGEERGEPPKEAIL